eukprot:1160858-Pelagomonas_calceolata.AAC.5
MPRLKIPSYGAHMRVSMQKTGNFRPQEAPSVNVLYIQNVQDASRRVPVKKEQSNPEVQASCRLWLRFILNVINATSIGSGECRKAARGQSGLTAIFATPRGSLTPD